MTMLFLRRINLFWGFKLRKLQFSLRLRNHAPCFLPLSPSSVFGERRSDHPQ